MAIENFKLKFTEEKGDTFRIKDEFENQTDDKEYINKHIYPYQTLEKGEE